MHLLCYVTANPLADRIAYGNQGLDGTKTQMVPFFSSHFSLSNDSGLQNDVAVVAGRDAALVGSLPEGHETNLRKITLKAPVCFIPTALRMVEQLQYSSRSASKTVLDCSSWENALGYFPPLDFSLSTKGKWATLELKQSHEEVWWNKQVCSFFSARYLWHKVKTADHKGVTIQSYLLRQGYSYTNDEWFTSLLYWSWMFIILFLDSPGTEEENKMNFPWSILASFQGQIGYWSPSLCLLRESLACQNRSLPWRLPISQSWLILCKLCPAGPNQGWWERGWGWLSESAVSQAVDAHDQ